MIRHLDSAPDAGFLAWLPERAPQVDEDPSRYLLVPDPTLPPGVWMVGDGMVGPGVWGFVLRAHPGVVRATEVRWPLLPPAQRALALMLLVEEAF